MKRLAIVLIIMACCSHAMAEPPAAATAGTQPAQDAAAAPKQTGALVAGQFGDWSLVCPETEDKTKPASCRLVQRLVEAKSKKTVFHLAVGYGPRGNLILVVRAPLGIALAKGLEFSLGDQTIHRAAFSTCRPDGCQAVLILPNELRQQMRKAEQAWLTAYGLSGKPFQTAASLKGFADGLSALDKRRGPS